jgi:hypothetical protein
MARNWLLFLARTVRHRGVFAHYWRHAVARLSQSATGGSGNARQVLREIGITGKWRARRQIAAVSDTEIFALCNGTVSVFPGARAKSLQPVRLISSPCLPSPLADAAADWKLVLVSFVDEPGPVPPELREICAEVVTVRRFGSELDSPSFRAALQQTIRKWQPERATVPPPCRSESTPGSACPATGRTCHK